MASPKAGGGAGGPKKSSIPVCVRARPAEISTSLINFDEKTVKVRFEQKRGTKHVINNQQEGISFKFEHVLDNKTQEEVCIAQRFMQPSDADSFLLFQVFNLCAADMVLNAIDGYNSTILAYGQTGSGKTHTISGGGSNSAYADRGLCARVIADLFKQLRNRCMDVTVSLSYMEIYNESIFDLLREPGADEPAKPMSNAFGKPAPSQSSLAVYEDKIGGSFVKGLLRPRVSGEDEALDLLFEGETNRAIAEHKLNQDSTRSHCILTLFLFRNDGSTEGSADAGGKSGGSTSSKLHLVDLAGSERQEATGSSGKVLKEACFINKSLTFLEQVQNRRPLTCVLLTPSNTPPFLFLGRWTSGSACPRPESKHQGQAGTRTLPFVKAHARDGGLAGRKLIHTTDRLRVAGGAAPGADHHHTAVSIHITPLVQHTALFAPQLSVTPCSFLLPCVFVPQLRHSDEPDPERPDKERGGRGIVGGVVGEGGSRPQDGACYAGKLTCSVLG
jgi:hypothetical protein